MELLLFAFAMILLAMILTAKIIKGMIKNNDESGRLSKWDAG